MTKQLDQAAKIFHAYVNCAVLKKLLVSIVSKTVPYTKYNRPLSAVILHSINHRQKYIHRHSLAAGY